MENAEEILQCLDEFAKMKPKDIPRELEEYLCFVAKTGDPVYQWSLIKNLFREKLINVITEFYESCPSVDIPPCPNVETFNYEAMKNFILEKLESFVAAPFTVQRICELLTAPRKEYNRIDKYMRALEKNVLVVSTREPGQRRNTENGDSILNGLESDPSNEGTISNEMHIEVDMEETPIWSSKTDISETHNYDAINKQTIDFGKTDNSQESDSEQQTKSMNEIGFATHDLDLNRIVPSDNNTVVESVITSTEISSQEVTAAATTTTITTSTTSTELVFVATTTMRQDEQNDGQEHSYVTTNLNLVSSSDMFSLDVDKLSNSQSLVSIQPEAPTTVVSTETNEEQKIDVNYLPQENQDEDDQNEMQSSVLPEVVTGHSTTVMPEIIPITEQNLSTEKPDLVQEAVAATSDLDKINNQTTQQIKIDDVPVTSSDTEQIECDKFTTDEMKENNDYDEDDKSSNLIIAENTEQTSDQTDIITSSQQIEENPELSTTIAAEVKTDEMLKQDESEQESCTNVDNSVEESTINDKIIDAVCSTDEIIEQRIESATQQMEGIEEEKEVSTSTDITEPETTMETEHALETVTDEIAEPNQQTVESIDDNCENNVIDELKMHVEQSETMSHDENEQEDICLREEQTTENVDTQLPKEGDEKTSEETSAESDSEMLETTQ